jgi:MFS family permease
VIARAFRRIYVPPLPKRVWLLEGAGLLSAMGNGFVLPFLVIYLHEVRGFSLPAAGGVVSVIGAASVVVSPVSGWLVDRFDPRVLTATAVLLAAVATGSLAFSTTLSQALVLAAALGVAHGLFRPSERTLMAAIVPPESRHQLFALQGAMGNLGIGIGAVCGGLVVSTAHPDSFTVVFLADAATFLPYVPVLSLLPRIRPAAARTGRRGYSQVFRARAFLALVAIDTALVLAGDSQFSSMLPVFAKEHAGVSEHLIGLLFLVNTASIVALQLPLARLMEGRRRMPGLAALCVLWAGVWVLVLASGRATTVSLAAAGLLTAAAVFAIGECLDGAIDRPLVADLAPEDLRGRYFAVHSSSSQLGFTLGPVLGGVLLAASPNALWLSAAVVCGACAFAALALERHLPRAASRTPRAALPPQPVAAAEQIAS